MHAPREGVLWGLVSDVHGNFGALERALALLNDAGVQRLAFLGDYLGRGDSDACVRRIRDVADVAILGNRDLDWQERVSSATKTWVRSLPRSAYVDGLLLAHGDARLTPALSTSQIKHAFARTWVEMERTGAHVFAFGHSHHARVWRKRSQASPAEALTGDCVPLEPPYRHFLNVGSTGLPFPGKGGPSVAVVDLANSRIRRLAFERA